MLASKKILNYYPKIIDTPSNLYKNRDIEKEKLKEINKQSRIEKQKNISLLCSNPEQEKK